jgi:hypothetical protein
MKATIVINAPVVHLGKIGKLHNSLKTLITVKDRRIEFFPRNGSIVLCTPSPRILKAVVIVTIVSLKFDAVATLRTDLSGATGATPKTVRLEVTLIRRTTPTIQLAVVSHHIVVIEYFATFATIAIILTEALIAITVTTGRRHTVVRIDPFVTAVTLCPAGFLCTFLTERINRLIVRTDKFAAIVTDEVAGQLDAIDTDSLFVKTVRNGRVRIIVRIEITLTIGTL